MCLNHPCVGTIHRVFIAELVSSFALRQTSPLSETGSGPVVDAKFTLIVQDGANLVSYTELSVLDGATVGNGESNSLLIPSLSRARLPTTHVGCLLPLRTGPR